MVLCLYRINKKYFDIFRKYVEIFRIMCCDV